MIFDIHDGYREAEKINNVINNMLIDSPISEITKYGWMAFTRTLKTTLDIINEVIKDRAN